ncbi:hypothetical protein EVAR_96599_1 [Eumeta japonica]|uniref:CRIB domain-containing protein n=1 Tax=Eumeta variegata TaxID=151549 RepID=A0A4C1WRN9_EUMVA|nr:hypothetical protein EVAR_96599_1 [Eumeta japonica]
MPKHRARDDVRVISCQCEDVGRSLTRLARPEPVLTRPRPPPGTNVNSSSVPQWMVNDDPSGRGWRFKHAGHVGRDQRSGSYFHTCCDSYYL